MTVQSQKTTTLSRRNLLTGSAALLVGGAMSRAMSAYATVAPASTESERRTPVALALDRAGSDGGRPEGPTAITLTRAAAARQLISRCSAC